jgi:hypothetical protein
MRVYATLLLAVSVLTAVGAERSKVDLQEPVVFAYDLKAVPFDSVDPAKTPGWRPLVLAFDSVDPVAISRGAVSFVGGGAVGLCRV